MSYFLHLENRNATHIQKEINSFELINKFFHQKNRCYNTSQSIQSILNLKMTRLKPTY